MTTFQNPRGPGQPTAGAGAGPGEQGGGIADAASQTAGTAADETRRVAGVAQEQAASVASQAKDQARSLMADARSELDQQSRTQKDRLTGTLRSFTDDLDSMASQSDGGMASEVVHQVAGRARALTDHLEGREPMDLLDDVRDFARRRPGTFLLGALAAGVVAGRLTRGARDAHQSGEPSAGAPVATGSPRVPDYAADRRYDDDLGLDVPVPGQRRSLDEPVTTELPGEGGLL